MKTKLVCAFLVLFVAATLNTGCSKTEKKKSRIGFSQSTMIDPWRINMLEQMKDAVKKHQDEIDFVYTDGQNDNFKQIADVEDLISKGIDLLIISPREAEPLTPVVRKAFLKGIPVITLDRNIVDTTYTCFIGASNLEIGEQAGALAAELLDGKGTVIEIEGILGATPTIHRSQGFHTVIDKYPDIKILAKQPADYLRDPALKLVEDLLQKYKTIHCLYAHNDEMALGALQALKAAGRHKGVVVIGIDGQKEAYQAIMNGEMTATFVYPNGSAEAIETGLKILRGEAVPKEIRLQTTRVDVKNAKELFNPDSYF